MVTHRDIVDVLLDQHGRMRRLCADVEGSGPAARKRLFAELDRLVNVHELGDRLVVHPAARRSTAHGDTVAVACMVEEGDLGRAFTGLRTLGVGHESFDARFAAAHRAILDHTEHEERDEFPVLRRYVTTQRLHMMVGELHDIQVMAAG